MIVLAACVVCAAACDAGEPIDPPPPPPARDAGSTDAGTGVGTDGGALETGAPEVGVDAGALDSATPPDATMEVDGGVECQRHEDCLGYRRCEGHLCVDPGDSNLAGALVLNEILIDGAADEDANGDGDIHGTEDEFVEIVNASAAPVDLGGFMIVETNHLAIPRHVFEAGFVVPAGEAVVVFGGGTPSAELEAIQGARFVVANAQDPAFSNGLNLNDAGDVLRLLDTERRGVFRFDYGDLCQRGTCPPEVSDRSLTRAPDLSGQFVPHSDASGASGAVFSPGTRADGAPFMN